MYTVETISSVSNAVPLKPFCQVSFWFREQRYRDLISEAEDTTHKGKWSVGDWKNDSGKSMAFREGELVFLKWWDSCEVVCNWDSTASNGNIYRTKTHANHMAEVIGFFFFLWWSLKYVPNLNARNTLVLLHCYSILSWLLMNFKNVK